MAEPLSSNGWISQFALRLMELRHQITMVEAVQYAVYQFPYARALEPELAASIFSAGHPQLVPLVTTPRSTERSTQASIQPD